MNGFGILLVILLSIAVAIGAFVFGTWVVVWNVSDMIDNGVNFWNVFWILLVLAGITGGTSKAAS